MGLIYSNAELVLAWLCEDRPEILVAIDTLGLIVAGTERLHDSEIVKLDWAKIYPFLCLEDSTSYKLPRGWSSLSQFQDLSYWRRIWTYQELILAKQIIFCTSSTYIDFEKANRAWIAIDKMAIRLKENRFERSEHMKLAIIFSISNLQKVFRIQDIYSGRQLISSYSMMPTYIIYCRFSKSTVVQIQHLIVRYRPYKIATAGWMEAFNSGAFQATDPRDHIYGLLALSRIELVPEYTATIASIYSKFISMYIEFRRTY